MTDKFGNTKLTLHLSMAVPMWLTEHADKTTDWLMLRKDICSRTIGEKGDVILYGSKTKGRAGKAFNHLAEGMAILLLITKGPVPFGETVFMPDGSTKTFDNQAAASKFVWPEKSPA